MALHADERYGLDPHGLRLEVVQDGTTSTIALFGECDLAQQDTLRAGVREAFAAQPEQIVLDLGGLGFIDSTGIRGIIELHKRARHENIRLVICPGSRQVQRIFDLSGLTAQLPFLAADQSARESRETPQRHP
jgi:anti-sigma B factor antagonist